ncbi:LuxR C-terminal-related transcriptional regulator [Pueribacillus sp. YX66]
MERKCQRIAGALQISEYTVQDYVKSVIKKLNARNRTKAVA